MKRINPVSSMIQTYLSGWIRVLSSISDNTSEEVTQFNEIGFIVSSIKYKYGSCWAHSYSCCGWNCDGLYLESNNKKSTGSVST